MIAGGGGSIIFYRFAARPSGGQRRPRRLLRHQGGALIQLAKVMAIDPRRRRNIRVNTLSPGRGRDAAHAEPLRLVRDRNQQIGGKHLLGRLGTA